MLPPVATASSTHISGMKVVKSNLRNKMGDDFLTDCLVCYIEKNLLIATDNEVPIQIFLNMTTRSADYHAYVTHCIEVLMVIIFSGNILLE